MLNELNPFAKQYSSALHWRCLAQRLLVMPHSHVICSVCDCRCWSAYSREASGSQAHVVAVWTLLSLVNTFYEGRGEAAGTPTHS